MHSIKYYKYKGDVSEHKDNIFVHNNKNWFIFCDIDKQVVTAELIRDHLDTMTGWKNFVEYSPTEPELDAISEGIARVVLHVGYDYA